MPIKIYHVALSGFLALLLGIGIVYLTAFFGAHVLAAPADDAEPTPDAEPAHAAAT
jgi:hypothetical protein